MFLQTMDMFKVFFAIVCRYNTLLNVLVRFRNKSHLVRIRERSCFGG